MIPATMRGVTDFIKLKGLLAIFDEIDRAGDEIDEEDEPNQRKEQTDHPNLQKSNETDHHDPRSDECRDNLPRERVLRIWLRFLWDKLNDRFGI